MKQLQHPILLASIKPWSSLIILCRTGLNRVSPEKYLIHRAHFSLNGSLSVLICCQALLCGISAIAGHKEAINSTALHQINNQCPAVNITTTLSLLSNISTANLWNHKKVPPRIPVRHKKICGKKNIRSFEVAKKVSTQTLNSASKRLREPASLKRPHTSKKKQRGKHQKS